MRCGWCLSHKTLIDYHDAEWGVPVHDDRHLFEMLILEGAQAGLNWLTVLKKRVGYKLAFDNFEAQKIVHYDQNKISNLQQDSRIIRHKLKILSVLKNARRFLQIQEEYGSFDKFIWQFVDGKTILNKYKNSSRIPATSKESDRMSRALKKRGFSFVGPTICYAYMQGTGMVNDHTTDCFRWSELNFLAPNQK